MKPPLYSAPDTSQDDTLQDDTSQDDAQKDQRPKVVTGPAPAPLVSTGGLATTFGDPGDVRRYLAAKQAGKSEKQALKVGDPGIGAPALGTVNTAQSYGVAVPVDWLEKTFGDDQSAWRKARVQLSIGDKTITVPIVDVGPGKGPRSKGVVSDMTNLLSSGLGAGGMDQVNIKIMPNQGPDYQNDRAGWDTEQKQIAEALKTPMALGSPAPTPLGRMFPSINSMTDKSSVPQTPVPGSASVNPDEHPIHQDMGALSKWLETATV